MKSHQLLYLELKASYSADDVVANAEGSLQPEETLQQPYCDAIAPQSLRVMVNVIAGVQMRLRSVRRGALLARKDHGLGLRTLQLRTTSSDIENLRQLTGCAEYLEVLDFGNGRPTVVC